MAVAQSQLRIGLLVPGRDTAPSSEWDQLLTARAWERWRNTSALGLEIELVIEDGGTTAANTTPALRSLVDEGVHAVVCCVTPASARAAQPFAAELPVLALAQRSASAQSESPWPLTLVPGPLPVARAMTAHARTHGGGVALLTLNNEFGARVEEAVRAGALEAGIPVTRSETFSPGTPVLTPEALLVAASVPGAVIVWAPPEDSSRALAALEARGYDGPVYLPWSVATEVTGGLRNGRLRGAYVAAPPVAASQTLPTEDPNSVAVENLRFALESAYGYYEATPQGALAFDGLEFLRTGADQAVVYGVDPAQVARFRQALRDALEALGPFDGAAGSYDFDGRSSEIALERGVEISLNESGRLRLP